MTTTIVPTLHCPGCDRQVRVVEPRAFGVDLLRSSLACGHVVAHNQH